MNISFNFNNTNYEKGIETMKNTKKVTCRPCKEQDNWEIMGPDGMVFQKHYSTRRDCVKAGREYANEFGCEMVVENKNDSNTTRTRQTMQKRQKNSK